VISERQRVAPDRGGLTGESARRLAAELMHALNRPSWLLEVSGVSAVGIASSPGAGRGVQSSFVRAAVIALPFASASVPAAHLGIGLGQHPDWRGALAEIARVLQPAGVLAALLGSTREDTLVVEVRTYFRTLLNVMLAWRPPGELLPNELQRPEQVDDELRRLGLGPPQLLNFRGECVLSARDIVDAEMRDLVDVPAGSDRVSLEQVAAKTLTWAAARVGGPDVPIVLGARRAYRIYERR